MPRSKADKRRDLAEKQQREAELFAKLKLAKEQRDAAESETEPPEDPAVVRLRNFHKAKQMLTNVSEQEQELHLTEAAVIQEVVPIQKKRKHPLAAPRQLSPDRKKRLPPTVPLCLFLRSCV